ncbi:cytochrome c family protein [Phreatobacter stygius]
MRIAFLTGLLTLSSALAAMPGLALAQDAAAGERVFAQCRACHQLGETARNGVGPQLNGLIGRTAGSVAGYTYSDAYKRPEVAAKVWSEENFAAYIRDPRSVTPGTRMVFAGLRQDSQVSNLIAYLRQFDASGKRSQ